VSFAFDVYDGIHSNGVLLAVVEDEETVFVHDQLSSIDNPTHLTSDYRLDRQILLHWMMEESTSQQGWSL
jgi:hypothetical protein